MADWTKLKLLDDLETRDDASGKSHVGRYYALTSDRASFPARGDDATAMSTSTVDLTGWYVNSVTVSAYSSTHCVVAIVATRYLRGGAAWSQTLLSEYEVEYSAAEITITAEMLGLVKKSDGNVESIPEDGEYMAAAYGSTGTRLTRAEWEAESYDPVACPFKRRPSATLIGKKFPTLIATITYHTSKRASSALDLALASGVLARESEASQWPLPTKYGLPNSGSTGTSATGGYWRAVPGKAQDAKPVRDPNTDRTYYRIIRRLERVPLINDMDDPAAQVLWSVAKNGGYLVW